MPTLAELQEKYGKKKTPEPLPPTEANISKEAISGSKKVQTTICPTCNKRHKITQDKDMDRNEIVDWFSKFITENKKKFTLDWLRGQKLTFESVNEMRKP